MSLDSKLRAGVEEAHTKKEYRPVAVGIVQNEESQILVVSSAMKPDEWYFPQGGIDEGEHPCDALFRELNQELGILPEELGEPDFLGDADLDAEATRIDRREFLKGKRYFFFRLTCTRESPLQIDPAELAACAWVPRRDVLRTISGTREAKRDLMMRFLAQAQ